MPHPQAEEEEAGALVTTGVVLLLATLDPGQEPPETTEVCKVVGALDAEAGLLAAVVDAADEAGAVLAALLPEAAVAMHEQTADALLMTASALATPHALSTQLSAEAWS